MGSLVISSSTAEGLAYMITVVWSRGRKEEIRLLGTSSCVASNVEVEKKRKVVLAASDIGMKDMERAWDNLKSVDSLRKLHFFIIDIVVAGCVKAVVQHISKGCTEPVTCRGVLVENSTGSSQGIQSKKTRETDGCRGRALCIGGDLKAFRRGGSHKCLLSVVVGEIGGSRWLHDYCEGNDGRKNHRPRLWERAAPAGAHVAHSRGAEHHYPRRLWLQWYCSEQTMVPWYGMWLIPLERFSSSAEIFLRFALKEHFSFLLLFSWRR